LLRRRRGSAGTFPRFVHEPIGPALFEAGARDLRTYRRPAATDELLGSAWVTALVADQHTAVTAVHAFNVERWVPVNRITTPSSPRPR
jgi:hypothetical protein